MGLPDEEALMLAAEENNVHILQLCLDQGTDPNTTAEDGYNAIMVAVCASKKQICVIYARDCDVRAFTYAYTFSSVCVR